MLQQFSLVFGDLSRSGVLPNLSQAGGEGEKWYKIPPSIPILSSVSASKRFDKVSDKPDYLSTLFENPLHSKT